MPSAPAVIRELIDCVETLIHDVVDAVMPVPASLLARYF
jgi:hypothetical protein